MDIVSEEFFGLIDTMKCREHAEIHHLEEIDNETLIKRYQEARAVCLAFHGYHNTTDKMLDIALTIREELKRRGYPILP